MSEFSIDKHSSGTETTNSEWSPAEFLAMIAHELRNANQAILGWVEIADSGPVNAETSARAFEVIKRNAQLQVELVNQLMDSSWPTKRCLRLDSQQVAIVSTLKSEIETMIPQASAKEIKLRAKLEHSKTCVISDAALLHQGFTN